MATTPQTTSYHRHRVGKGRLLFFVPGGPAHRLVLGLDQTISHQGDQREQAEQHGRGPRNGQVVPLSLSFYPQMRPRLFKSYFHAPTPHEPAQDLLRRMIEIGREQSLRIKLTPGIANQHPADRHWTVAATIPERRLGVDFDFTRLPAIPMINLNLSPPRPAMIEHLLRSRAACSFDARSPNLSYLAFGRWIVKLCIQTQPRDQINARRAAHQVKQIEHSKTAISHKNHISIGQPAGDQCDDLPSAISQPLMLAFQLG